MYETISTNLFLSVFVLISVANLWKCGADFDMTFTDR